jgi:hypothetical protein
MGMSEIEIWADDAYEDYARVVSGLDDDDANELYQHLVEEAENWYSERGLSPDVYMRTTGRDVYVADVLKWYEEEELLERIEVDEEVAFQPASSVQEALEQPRPSSSLSKLDD